MASSTRRRGPTGACGPGKAAASIRWRLRPPCDAGGRPGARTAGRRAVQFYSRGETYAGRVSNVNLCEELLYAEARPRAANGARAVAVRSGRRTMRVSELVGRMLGNLCRRAKEAG